MKKGFTIIELLAAIAIMALIIVISVPAYDGISKSIKEQSLNNKLSMIENATSSYVNKYHKDKVYDGEAHAVCYSIKYLIDKNVFSADNETEDGITDPLNGGDLNGYLVAQYDTDTYEVTINYSKKIASFSSSNCDNTYGTI